MAIIELAYAPRTPLHAALHAGMDRHRFGAVVAHRRFGKTVCAVLQLIVRCLENRRRHPVPRYAFIAPFLGQAKTAAWEYLTYYTGTIPGAEPMISELKVTMPHGGYVRLFGADNPKAFRGGYWDGVVYDEFGEQPPNIHSEIMRPTLSDYEGWALFLGTPAGKNQFYQAVKQAQADPTWFYAMHKASETHIIPETELLAARKDMTEDEYQQEYECSFEAAVKGAIFASELGMARSSGRVGVVPYDPILPVDTDWDLGVGDSTAIWFSQSIRSGEIRIIDYYENSGEGLPHYAQVLKDKGYTYGEHWAPHDIQVKELASGRSRLEAARSLGISFRVCPNVALEDGIHAARMVFPRCYFDERRTAPGLEALQHYRRDYNTRLNEFKAVPVHDWACVAGETKVLTRSGTYQIQYLPNSGEVLTLCGWKRYENPRITRRNAPLVAVTFEDGLTVSCTPEHRFLTDNGWKCASELRTGLLIQSSLTRSFNISTAISTAFGRLSDILQRVAADYIATYGNVLLARFLPVVTSTTETAIPQTINSPILNACQPQNIYEPTGFVSLLGGAFISRQPPVLKPQRGINQKLDGHGTVAWGSASRVGRNGSASRSLAAIADKLWKCLFGALVMLRNIVRKPARHLRIASVTALPGTADVWCLTVPDGHQWTLENGAVTHNSHGADAFRYLAVRQKTPQVKRQINWGAPLGPWNG